MTTIKKKRLKTAKEKRMDEEHQLCEWSCLQVLLQEAGLLSDEQVAKLTELSDEGTGFFDHYRKGLSENLGNLRLVVEEGAA